MSATARSSLNSSHICLLGICTSFSSYKMEQQSAWRRYGAGLALTRLAPKKTSTHACSCMIYANMKGVRRKDVTADNAGSEPLQQEARPIRNPSPYFLHFQLWFCYFLYAIIPDLRHPDSILRAYWMPLPAVAIEIDGSNNPCCQSLRQHIREADQSALRRR